MESTPQIPKAEKATKLPEPPLEDLMPAQMEVLQQILGDDEGAWVKWLDYSEPNGKRMREVLTNCYYEHEQSFPPECIAEVIAVLQEDSDQTPSWH